MLYEHGDNPAVSLPFAVQVDLGVDEFAALMSEKESELTSYEVADLGDVTFGGVMKELKALLNAKQYNKARTTLTKAVADFSYEMGRAHEQQIIDVQRMKERAQSKAHRAAAMRSHASHPSISPEERMDFMQEAHQAESDKALAEASAEKTASELELLKQQMAAMQAMLMKLADNKDENDG